MASGAEQTEPGIRLTGELTGAGPAQSYQTQGGATVTPWEATLLIGRDAYVVRFRDQAELERAIPVDTPRMAVVTIDVAARIAGSKDAAARCWVEWRGFAGANGR